MTHATRRLALVLVALVGLSVAACASAASSVAPTAPITTTTPPSASPAAVSCPVEAQTGNLPSDRLTGMQVLGVPGADLVRFEFGPGSLTPAGPPVGSLDVATPPFTEGASGLPIDLAGEQALQAVFRHMSLQNDVGQETYTGEREIRSDDPSRRLRHVVLFDESEGQIGWYLGYDGPACVTLAREGNDVVVSFTYGSGS